MNMRLAALLLSVFQPATARVTSYELLDYDSVADTKAVITRGQARFTILTPRLIRMEQANKLGGPFGPCNPCHGESQAACATVRRARDD